MNIIGQEKFASRENELTNLSMLIMQLQDENVGGVEVGTIFLGEDNPVIIVRSRNMSEITQSLRFLYCIDPVGDIGNDQMSIVE